MEEYIITGDQLLQLQEYLNYGYSIKEIEAYMGLATVVIAKDDRSIKINLYAKN